MSFQKVPCVDVRENKRMEEIENAQLGESARAQMSGLHDVPAGGKPELLPDTNFSPDNNPRSVDPSKPSAVPVCPASSLKLKGQ